MYTLNEKITYITLLRKNSITVLPQIAHLRELVLLKGHFLVKLSLTYQFIVYSWSVNIVRFTQVSKMLKKWHFKV